MSFQARLRNAVSATASTEITGSTQTVNGSAVPLNKIQPGTEIVCQFTLGVTTSSVTITPYLEVSRDGSTWRTYKTGTATAAGTGTVVTTRECLGSYSALPYEYIRGSAISNGTAAVSGDTIALSWDYLAGD
jgi:hypothetical protein